jgi:hypothetical protein
MMRVDFVTKNFEGIRIRERSNIVNYIYQYRPDVNVRAIHTKPAEQA